MAEVTNVHEIFAAMKENFNTAAAAGMNAVYQFDLTGDDGAKYYLSIVNGALDVQPGTHEKPNITVTAKVTDYVAIANGKLNPQMAFMSGKLKVAGDMSLAMKMQSLFPRPGS